MVRGVKNPLWFELGSRLSQVREIQAITLLDLGVRSCVARNTIANIERGKAQPSIDTVERIAAALGISACWLAFGVDGKERFQARIRRLGLKDKVPRGSEQFAFEGLHAGCHERLRARREVYGLSLRELAERSGVSHQTIRNVEKGIQVPRVDSVHRLAVSLDLAPCWLAYGIGRKPGRVLRDNDSAAVI